MRKLQLLAVLSIGIMASASGFIQAQATDYTYFVDFDTKKVANFNDYTQMFLETTYDLDNTLTWTINTNYRMNSCPPSAATDVKMEINYRLNGVGAYILLSSETLPDMPCTISDTFYQITKTTQLPSNVLDALIDDDANFIEFFTPLIMFGSGSTPSRVITLTNTEFVITLNYDFDTTYLFNYFLSDSQYLGNLKTGSVVLTGADTLDFDYVMTSAGNDRYFIINTNTLDYSLRTKFAIDYNMEYFRGESIGSRYKMINETLTWTIGSSGLHFYGPQFRYYYLNAATASQAIVDAPEFDFTYEDCGWDVFDIPCFINNGLAYITNDAPIISDAITLLNAGLAMAAQTFGIIGAFTTDNVFGYLILAGFGFIAVRWFLKND